MEFQGLLCTYKFPGKNCVKGEKWPLGCDTMCALPYNTVSLLNYVFPNLACCV
jgi:hypothetical protein